MQVAELVRHARERLGMEVQALTPAPPALRDPRTPRVWEMLTEGGYFWLAERDDSVEIFRALAFPTRRRSRGDCRSPAQAARQFIALHPR